MRDHADRSSPQAETAPKAAATPGRNTLEGPQLEGAGQGEQGSLFASGAVPWAREEDEEDEVETASQAEHIDAEESGDTDDDDGEDGEDDGEDLDAAVMPIADQLEADDGEDEEEEAVVGGQELAEVQKADGGGDGNDDDSEDVDDDFDDPDRGGDESVGDEDEDEELGAEGAVSDEDLDAELDRELVPDGPGQQLDGSLRGELESETGYDLDQVRIHHGGATGSKLRDHGKLGATKGKNIMLVNGSASTSDPEYRDLVRHEVMHVIQQANGLVSSDLGHDERGRHEADADRRGTGAVHGSLRPLTAPSTGPAQFHIAYDGPPPAARRRPAPRPRPAPPPPRPVYTPPAVVLKRAMGPDWRPPVVRRPKPKPRPKPYVLRSTGDQHWNDANLRGQSVKARFERASHRHAVANARARKTGGDSIPFKFKATRRERRDLNAAWESDRIAQEGVEEVRRYKAKKAAEEARRRREAEKKKEGNGFLGWKKAARSVGKVASKAAHVTLDVAGNIPGPIGAGASTANAGLYFAEGDSTKGKEKLVEAAVGLVPIPGSKAAGKLLYKGVRTSAVKLASKKASGKAATRIVMSAKKAKVVIKQNKDKIKAAGSELYEDAIKDQVKAAGNDAVGGADYDPLKTAAGTLAGAGGSNAARAGGGRVRVRGKTVNRTLEDGGKKAGKGAAVKLRLPRGAAVAVRDHGKKAGENVTGAAGKTAGSAGAGRATAGGDKKKNG